MKCLFLLNMQWIISGMFFRQMLTVIPYIASIPHIPKEISSPYMPFESFCSHFFVSFLCISFYSFFKPFIHFFFFLYWYEHSSLKFTYWIFLYYDNSFIDLHKYLFIIFCKGFPFVYCFHPFDNKKNIWNLSHLYS